MTNESKAMLSQWVKLLKRAKRHIQSEKINYVCNAISYAKTNDSIDASCSLRDWIEESLDKNNTVQAWLKRIAGVPEKALKGEALREYRLRWIDHMIQQFEEWRKE